MTVKVVIYEVNLELEAAIAAEFDRWLDKHIDEMLRLSGFESAQVYSDEGTTGEVVNRTVQYRVRSEADLDNYLTHHATAMRAEGQDKFSGRFTATRRVLTPVLGPEPAVEAAQSCQNCGYALTGQYCSDCGQRSNVRLITLWELAKDVVGDVFELDSRLWRTLRPLLFRPGLLTREYLAGRRVHYVPPFRMYLVFSLVFFLITSMGGDLEVTTDGGGTDQDIKTGGEGLTALKEEFREELEEELGTEELAALEEELRGDFTQANESADGEDSDDLCAGLDEQSVITGQALERMQRSCTRISDDPEAFGKALLDNVPTMLFFFLPLIALVMKGLYLGSGRYYVEHLLFFVHYHSFFFLILTLSILLWQLADLLPIGSVIPGLVTAAVVIYIPVYLFRAMRVVYRHGILAGILRYTFLLIAYFVCLLLTFLVTLAFTALTI